MAEARAAISWIVGRPKVAWLATTTKLKWTVYGRLFPTTRSTMQSHPTVALMSALQGRWARTRAFCSASFCLRRAEGSTGRVADAKKRKSHVKSGAMGYAQHCTSDCVGSRARCAGVRSESRD